jgi:hypothetical protein
MAIPGLAKTADEKLPACFKDGTGISCKAVESSGGRGLGGQGGQRTQLVLLMLWAHWQV